MKIVYYLDDARYITMARIAVTSARAVMPGEQIVQLTNETTPAVEGVDEVVRVKVEGLFPYRRCTAHAQIQGEALFLDVDTICRRDVAFLFELDFDIALPEVADPFVRYTGGVVFSRKPSFWQAFAAHQICAGAVEPHVRDLLLAFGAHVDSWPGRVERLQQDLFEALPRSETDTCEQASIVHYRGPRKRWMPGLTEA